MSLEAIVVPVTANRLTHKIYISEKFEIGKDMLERVVTHSQA